jgi:hypothetical protein
VLRVPLPYHSALYAPLVLLHASLAARVLGGLIGEPAALRLGAWGNAVAIALFIVAAGTLVLRRSKVRRGTTRG